MVVSIRACCGHKNKISGKQDCNYWAHQWCVNLYFKTEEKLNAVIFFCPQHGQSKKTSSGKNIKNLTWNYNTHRNNM